KETKLTKAPRLDRLLLKTMADELSNSQNFGGRGASSRQRVPTWSTTNRREYRNDHGLHECHRFDIPHSPIGICASSLWIRAWLRCAGSASGLNGRISARHFSKKS